MSAKEIRELIADLSKYVYVARGQTNMRIVDARVRAGVIEVKHLNSGKWFAYVPSRDYIFQQ